MKPRPPNNRDTIVMAAVDLPHGFTIADLVVAAWERDPDSFGLAGYRTQYPDAQRVMSKLYGATGIVARKWMTWVGQCHLCVTAEGRAHAKRLARVAA